MSQKWYEKLEKKKKKPIPQESTLEDKLSVLPLYDYLEHEDKVYFKTMTVLGEKIHILPRKKFFERLNHLEDYIRREHSDKPRDEQIKILYLNLTFGSLSYEPFKNSEEYFDYLENERGYTLEYDSGNVKAFMKKGSAEIIDSEKEPKSELEKFIEVKKGKKSQIPKLEDEERDSWITEFAKSVRDKLRHKKSDEND